MASHTYPDPGHSFWAFVYTVAGLIAWAAIATLISAPWSLLVMVGVLLIYWKYFSGSWWPKTTAETRNENFRVVKMSTGGLEMELNHCDAHCDC